jgi:hypothetical protein
MAEHFIQIQPDIVERIPISTAACASRVCIIWACVHVRIVVDARMKACAASRAKIVLISAATVAIARARFGVCDITVIVGIMIMCATAASMMIVAAAAATTVISVTESRSDIKSVVIAAGIRAAAAWIWSVVVVVVVVIMMMPI